MLKDRIIQLGCVSYINAYPFSIPMANNNNISLHLDVPSCLVSKLQDASLDAALTSSIGSLTEKISYIPNYGIAADKKILSVLCYYQKSFFQKQNPVIALTTESKTSIALLKILCHYLWNIADPQFEYLPSDIILKNPHHYDAFLLIGNIALQYPSFIGFQSIDLAEAWHELSSLPFVFALTLVRESFTQVNELNLAMETALLSFEKNSSTIIKQAVERCNLPQSIIETYYSLCKYSLGPRELQGLQTFLKYHHELTEATKYSTNIR